MIKTNYKFVKKYLAASGNKIYINNKQVMTYKEGECPYPIVKLESSIINGDPIVIDEDDPDEVIQISYHQLNDMGYGVGQFAIDKNKRVNPYQKFWYGIKKITSVSTILQDLKKGMKIQLDKINNRVRVVGTDCGGPGTRSGVSPWVYTKKKAESEVITPMGIADMNMWGETQYDPIQAMIADSTGEYYNVEKKTVIKELPVMISVDNEIVCIPQTDDIQTVAIGGDRGTGKSLMTVRQVCQIFYKWGDKVCLFNDALGQFHGLSVPCQNADFKRRLKTVGEQPAALPIVNLHVACPKTDMDEIDNDTNFLYTVNSYDFFNDYIRMTNGIPDVDLGKPGRTLNLVKKEFAKMGEISELRDIMEREIPNSQKDGFQNMIFRWEQSIGNVFKLRFLDSNYKSNPMVSSNWTVRLKNGKMFTGDPVVVCMKAGIIPNLKTQRAKSYAHCRNVLANTIDKILEYQLSQPYGAKERVWIPIDEIGDLYSKGMSADLDNLVLSMIKMFRQGRHEGVGMIYNIQALGNVHPDLVKEANILISFQIGSSEKERKIVRDAFGLSPDESKQMASLRKNKFELMIFGKEPFIVYDKDGNRKVGRKLYRGFLIPPNCDTLKNKVRDVDEKEDNIDRAEDEQAIT